MAIRIGNSSIKPQISTFDTKSLNTLEDYVQDFTEGYIMESMNTGEFTTITQKTLEEWLSSPDTYYKEISNLMTYMYITDGSIYQLYTLIQVLPSLNYKVKVFDTTVNGYEKNLAMCNKILSKVKYKPLTRDLLSQECVNGWVVCMWLGNKKQPYLYIFDNQDYVFPAFRRNGEWVCKVDMKWFEGMKDEERELMYETFSGVISESDYNKYLSNKEEFQYVELPQDKTTALRINTLFRNQRIGLPMGTQYLFDHLHKQTLKNLEKSISMKIIKNIAVLTIGDEENPYNKIGKPMKKKIVSSVKNALQKSVVAGAVPVAILPEFSKLEWSKLDGDKFLEKEKFESINLDINNDLGISPALTSGSGANFATATLNLDILYKRIGVMLEGIEDVFNKLFKLVLNKSVADNFMFEYEKEKPLSRSEVLDVLMKLQSQGFSVQSVVDMLPDVSFDPYLNASLYEQEVLKIYEKIKPPLTSYTATADDNSGNEEMDISDVTSEETISSKTNDKNSLPSPS